MNNETNQTETILVYTDNSGTLHRGTFAEVGPIAWREGRAGDMRPEVKPVPVKTMAIPTVEMAGPFVAGDTCPKCGGTIIAGHRSLGCDQWRAGCTFRAPFPEPGTVEPGSVEPERAPIVMPRGAVMAGEAGTVSQAALARQARVNGGLSTALALATGDADRTWAHTPSLYAPGSRVNAVGVANFEREGRALEAMDPIEVAAEKVARRIDSERRHAVPVNIQAMRLEVDGDRLLLRHGASERDTPALVPVTQEGLSAILDYWPATFGSVKRAILDPFDQGGFDASESADLFNRYVVDRWADLERSAVLRARVGNRDEERRIRRRRKVRGPTVGKGDVSLWLRTDPDGEVQAYAATSIGNTSHELDGARFLRIVADTLRGAGLRGEVEYDPATTRVRFTSWATPNTVVDLSAGDVFKVGISGGTSDGANGGFWLDLSAVRNLCLNLIILANENARVFSGTHGSDADTIAGGLRTALNKMDAGIDVIRAEWGILRATPLRSADDAKDREREAAEKALSPAVNRLHAEGLLPAPAISAEVAIALYGAARAVKLPGIRKDAMVEGVLRGWAAEPGETAADVLNAITRMHLQAEIDQFDLARQAGELVPVLVGSR